MVYTGSWLRGLSRDRELSYRAGVVTGLNLFQAAGCHGTWNSPTGLMISNTRFQGTPLGCQGRFSSPGSWIFIGDYSLLLAPGLSRDLGLLLVPGCHGMEFSPGTRVVAGEHLLDPTTILMTIRTGVFRSRCFSLATINSSCPKSSCVTRSN